MKVQKKIISIIMPALNEEYHICQNIKETLSVFKNLNLNCEIIVVDDGSKDNTFTEIKNAANEDLNISAYRLSSNKGKGYALKYGFNNIHGDLVIFLDSDLDIPPYQIPDLLKIMSEKEADVIIGSKRHPESELDYPFHRKVMSDIYAILLFFLFRLPLRDTQTGLKIFKAEVLKRVYPKVLCKRFAYDVEILANANRLGYKIVETPVRIKYRRKVKWGRIGFRDIILIILDTMAIFYRMHILKYYDKIDDKIGTRI